MARIAFILLTHKDPQGVVDQARRLTAAGDYVAIHYDRGAPADGYRLIRQELSDHPGVTFAPVRIRCGWGEWSLVAATLAALVAELGLKPEKVAVERNGTIVPRSTLGQVPLADGDVLEIVHFVGGGDHHAGTGSDGWEVAGRRFTSRLIVGTGKYKDFAQNAAALEASGAEIVTVAVRRVNVSDPNAPMLTDFIDPKKITYLPNTAGCFTADEAIRTLRLAREAGG